MLTGPDLGHLLEITGILDGAHLDDRPGRGFPLGALALHPETCTPPRERGSLNSYRGKWKCPHIGHSTAALWLMEAWDWALRRGKRKCILFSLYPQPVSLRQ